MTNIASIDSLHASARYRLKTVKPSGPRALVTMPDNVDAVMRHWEKSFNLTFSEMQVLELAVREEHSMTLIAKKRKVTPSTVKKQIRSLLRKTGDLTLGHAALRVLREALLMQ